MNVVDNGTFMYAKRGNLVDADASDHLMPKPARLEVIQGHTFWDH